MILLVLVSFSLLVSGCSAKKRITPVSNTFLEDVDISHKEENLPFDHSWVNAKVKPGHYKAILIKPIRTDLIPKSDWRKSESTLIKSESDYFKEADLIVNHFKDEIIKYLSEHKQQRIKIAQAPGPEVAELSIVMTELEFSHPAARAASLIAPVPGTGAVVGAISDPHAAFALRVTDSQSGELLATAADRKFPPTRIVDLNKLTVSSSAREVCSLWAETIADAIQQGRMAKIKDVGGFSLLPF